MRPGNGKQAETVGGIGSVLEGIAEDLDLPICLDTVEDVIAVLKPLQEKWLKEQG